MGDTGNADAWGLPGVLDFFEEERTRTDHVYSSEWFFLRDQLREGISVLDIGCAQGGFAGILSEHLSDFRYVGVDINASMIDRAREKFPGHTFHHVAEGDYSVLGRERFDLVIVFGILHLHETWRDTLATGWRHTAGTLVFDLRQIDGPSIEDKSRSWFSMSFGGANATYTETTLPYNLINAGDAQRAVLDICDGAARIASYGYFHPVSESASCPVDRVMATTWCAMR